MENMFLVTSTEIQFEGRSVLYGESYFGLKVFMDSEKVGFSENDILKIITFENVELAKIKLSWCHINDKGWFYICNTDYKFPKSPFIISSNLESKLTSSFKGELNFELSKQGKKYLELNKYQECFPVSSKKGMYGFLTKQVIRKNIFQERMTFSLIAFGIQPKKELEVFIFADEDKSDIHLGTIKWLDQNGVVKQSH